jgi:hypothetical protein
MYKTLNNDIVCLVCLCRAVLSLMLNVAFLYCYYECRDAECRYPGCCGTFGLFLIKIMFAIFLFQAKIRPGVNAIKLFTVIIYEFS